MYLTKGQKIAVIGSACLFMTVCTGAWKNEVKRRKKRRDKIKS